MPPVDKDLTAPAWMEKAPLSPNSLYPAELNPSPGAPVMFGPNITGVVPCQKGTASSGAFANQTETTGTRVTGNERSGTAVTFDASRSSSIYSSSSTVQPPAIRFLPCIKI